MNIQDYRLFKQASASVPIASMPWYYPKSIARNFKNFGKALIANARANPLIALMAGTTLLTVPLQVGETVDMIRHPDLYVGPNSFKTM